MIKKYGFVRVASAIPKVKIGNTIYNVEEIKNIIKESEKNSVEVTLFPELAITSYSAGDLFYNEKLLNDALDGLIELKKYTKKLNGIYIIGLPLRINNFIYDVMAAIQNGKILGIVPKLSADENNRWFKDGKDIKVDTIIIDEEEVNVGDLVFKNDAFTFDIKIGNRRSNTDALITFNPASTLALVGKNNDLKIRLQAFTKENINGLVYAGNSALETTTDTLQAPNIYIIENGNIVEHNEEITFDTKLVISDIDIHKLRNLKNRNVNYYEEYESRKIVNYTFVSDTTNLLRKYPEYPFIPSDEYERNNRLGTILNIQAHGLARRLEATGIKKCVLGISGGLDSTLAFLVTIKAFDILKYDRKDIIGITLPGFGTTNRTYKNACDLVTNYNATLKEISIKDACIQHFKDIEHDINSTDITYENAQARERTQILLDYANKVNGLVVGTGDLSELVLGWCTFNGDQISNYGVNASIPKTLVKYITKYYAETESNKKAKKVLLDILDTPVSPELLPPSESGEILQKTENSVGPYILHDFFMYHFLTYGASPSKLYFLAINTFKDMEKSEIKKWLRVFINRFFTQQFKRSCSVDGAKVGNISLSPRGDLVLPSDANREAYLKEIDEL